MSHYNFLLLLIPVTLNSADVKVSVSQGEMLSRDNPGMLPTELAKTVSGSSGASYGSGLPGDKGVTNWPPVVLVAQNSWDLLIHSKPGPSSFQSRLCVSDVLPENSVSCRFTFPQAGFGGGNQRPDGQSPHIFCKRRMT